MPLSLHSEVSHVSSCLGQQCILVLMGAPLLSDVPPKLAGTYVCPPPPPCPRTQTTCHDALVPIQLNSALKKNPSLKEGQPSENHQTIHLIQELRNLCSLPKSALDLGSPLSEY